MIHMVWYRIGHDSWLINYALNQRRNRSDRMKYITTMKFLVKVFVFFFQGAVVCLTHSNDSNIENFPDLTDFQVLVVDFSLNLKNIPLDEK